MTQSTHHSRNSAFLNLLLCFALLLAAFAPKAYGQENFGTISGVVSDATGAVIPDAQVELSSPTLPRGLQVATDSQGRFLFPRVPTGVYSLSVSKQGFSKYVQRNIEVKLGSALLLNANLTVGQVAEVVEVTAEAVQLDVTSSATSTNITSQVFDNLPKGRNFHTLFAMAPGVRFEPKNGNAGVGGFQVDGASGSENAFLIDGADISDIRRGSLRVQNSVPFEFLSEIQIKSSGFGAEFGGATGGVMNVASRGGSNAFHGLGMFQVPAQG